MKHLKLKRLLSAVLAGTMSLTLAATAYAADNETVITATYEEQEIAVTLPATVDAFINPYGVDILADSSDDTSTLSGFQILSKPECIYNLSGMDLSVSATVTGKVVERTDKDTTKAMKFATASTDGGIATAKSAYVTFQMKVDKTLIGAASAIDADVKLAAAQAWKADADADGEVVVKAGETTGEDLVQLKAADVSTPATPEVKAGGGAMIRLNGDCVTTPKVAWDEQDSFTVTIAYTFMPTTIEEAP